MHPLEQQILLQLMSHPSLRYADLKKPHHEGSYFTYHLKSLIKRGLVSKLNSGLYELSSQGKLYVDKLQIETLQVHPQPRILVLLAIQDDKLGWLLFKRKMQPVINMIGFPHCNVVIGQSLIPQAEASLEHDTGLRASLQHVADGYITMYRGDEPESSILFHLLTAKNPTRTLDVSSTDVGEYMWQTSIDFNDPLVMPSMKPLCELVENPPKCRPFLELVYKLP